MKSASKRSQRRERPSGLSTDAQKKIRRLKKELRLRSAFDRYVPKTHRRVVGLSMGDLIKGRVPKGPKGIELRAHLKRLSQCVINELATGNHLHSVVDTEASAAEIEDFIDAVVLEAREAQVIALNPFASSHEDLESMRSRSRAFRQVFPKDADRRRAISSVLGSRGPDLNELERILKWFEARMTWAIPKSKGKRGRRGTDPALHYFMQKVDILAQNHFGKALKKKRAFVLAVLKTQALADFVEYDPKRVNQNSYRSLYRRV